MDSLTVPIWVAEMLERIHESDYARVELIVLNQAELASSSISEKLRKRWREIPSIISRRVIRGVYNLVDRRRTEYRYAFRPVDCAPLFAEVPRLQVMPIMKKYSDYLSSLDLIAIREYQIDVFIRLGFRILRGEVLRLPRYGIWSYHHGDYLHHRGGPAGFWEVFNQQSATGSILQILTEDLDNGQLIFRSISCTDRTSLIRNKCRVYWKTSSFVPRKLKELHRDGPEIFFQRIKARMRDPILYSNRLFTPPSNWVMTRLLLRTFWNLIRSRIRSFFFFDQWVLLLSRRNDIDFSLWRFKKLIPPRDRFWADPHVISRGGRYYVFIEEYFYATRRGRIACLEVDRDGNWTEPYPVLERDYHLSYPFVFEHHGHLYMLPETSERDAVELYRCVEFPKRWEFHKTLMEGVSAYDPTLHFYGERWWLFCNVRENEGASSWDELFLFHSDSPLADRWLSHPMNPIVSDASCARPAGRLFEHNGRLYRPSQNCTTRYGYGFNLSEIETLNEQDYSERVVASAYPHWDRRILATHSFNFAEGLTVGDALLKRSRWAPFSKQVIPGHK